MSVECVGECVGGVCVWVEWMGEGCIISVQVHVQGCAHTGRWWWLVLTTSGHKKTSRVAR